MIQKMAGAGFIEPSSSPWAVPAVLFKKKDGTWHLCVDYHRLNEVTRKDYLPLPCIDNAPSPTSLGPTGSDPLFSAVAAGSRLQWQEQQQFIDP